MFGLGKTKKLRSFIIYAKNEKAWETLNELIMSPKEGSDTLLKPIFLSFGAKKETQKHVEGLLQYDLESGGYLRMRTFSPAVPQEITSTSFEGYVFSLEDVPKSSRISNETIDTVFWIVHMFIFKETGETPDKKSSVSIVLEKLDEKWNRMKF